MPRRQLDARLDAELELAERRPEELTRSLYRLVLRREPEPDALLRAASKLEAGTLSPATLVYELVTSGEFARVRALDDAIAFAAWARGADERPRDLRAPPATDERLIEIPWTLARLRDEARVLDCGYAYAEPPYLAALVRAVRGEVVGVDLAEAEVPGLRAVVADLRALPFERQEFDIALCLSTIEHVGRDNRVYGLDPEHDESGLDAALRELRRVARRVLVTVPCGEPADLGSQLQLDVGGWLDRFRSAGFVVWEHEPYELTEEGWAAADDPRGAYGSRGPGAAGVLCAELHAPTLTTRLRAWRHGRK